MKRRLCEGKRVRMGDSDSDDESTTVVKYVAPATIFYRGEIQEPFATQFCMKLRKASRRVRGTNTPVQVFLSSHGGDAYGGIAMYEHICMVKKTTEVHVIADGYVASAATLVLLAASRRIMCRHATLMIHAVTSYGWGGMKPKQLDEEAENTRDLMKLLTKIYKTHSSMKTKQLERLLDCERNLTYEKCLEYGLIDGDC